MCYSIPLYLYVSTEKILVLEQSSGNTKLFSYKICKKYNITIKYMKIDKEQIYY